MGYSRLIFPAICLLALFGYAASMPLDETADIQAIAGFFKDNMNEQFSQNCPWLRQAHAKQHGCLLAYFNISQTMPQQYKIGLFSGKYGNSFKAFVRFSNAGGRSFNAFSSGFNVSDANVDGRGVAVKLINVPGQKVLPGEQNSPTADFLFTTGPTAFVSDSSNAKGFFGSVADGAVSSAAWLAIHPSTAVRLTKFGIQGSTTSMLNRQFWGITTHRYGSTYARWQIVACNSNQTPQPDYSKPNFLQQALQLSNRYPTCYNLQVQLYTDPTNTPIEDVTAAWDAPAVSVATINFFPGQTTAWGAKQDAFCRALAFNPNRVIPEHEAVGWLERLRTIVYQNMANQRHQLNKQNYQEPTEADWNNYLSL